MQLLIMSTKDFTSLLVNISDFRNGLSRLIREIRTSAVLAMCCIESSGTECLSPLSDISRALAKYTNALVSKHAIMNLSTVSFAERISDPFAPYSLDQDKPDVLGVSLGPSICMLVGVHLPLPMAGITLPRHCITFLTSAVSLSGSSW